MEEDWAGCIRKFYRLEAAASRHNMRRKKGQRMNTDEKLERLAARYWTLASIPEEERNGYVKGFLDGIRDALIALGKLEVISIISKVHESDSSGVPEG